MAVLGGIYRYAPLWQERENVFWLKNVKIYPNTPSSNPGYYTWVMSTPSPPLFRNPKTATLSCMNYSLSFREAQFLSHFGQLPFADILV